MMLKRFVSKFQVILRHAVRAPHAVAGATVGIIAVLVAMRFTAEFFVICSGLAGAWAGYAHRRPNNDENPWQMLRSLWGLNRAYVLIGVSAVSALLAFGFLMAWIGAWGETTDRNTLFLAGAVACYAFSASFYLFGRYRLSRAQDTLKTATAQQIHEWRREDPVKRKPGLSEIF